MSDPAVSPLSQVPDDALAAIFTADPLTLDDAALRTLVLELRRRRNAFTAEEAAKALKPAKSRTKAEVQPAETAPTLDKPTTEISAADLFGEE